ncbi:hypothetical protein BDW02DRAFT_593341 [Decorospora gaudefroyi]|uniref:Uncharacterized protein n=1 Tax=Decorospora gaudefroyi TaxID=184978 RepID=A0A6A5K224_9PLEO|nr:hypothetical protein BDW02DRAFT_593341 [Decorospora gaudefroyi]
MLTTTTTLHTTTRTVYVADGTTDGKIGYYNHTDDSTNVIRKPILIQVEDARTLSKSPTTKEEGYQLVDFHTKLPEGRLLNSKSPENKKVIEEVYFDECRRLVQEVTSAAEAYPYVYRVRNQEQNAKASNKSNFHTDFVLVVHVDRDDVTAPQRLRALLSAEKAEMLLSKYKSYGSINVWRPVKNVVQKWPLMLVDHKSIENWDYSTHMFTLHSSNDERTILTHDKRYRYIYASDMTPDEAWLFFAFHSDPALGIPHGAF